MNDLRLENNFGNLWQDQCVPNEHLFIRQLKKKLIAEFKKRMINNESYAFSE